MPSNKKTSLRDLGFATYAEYLRSRHWRRFRVEYKKARPWQCAICHDSDRLELHHVTYERLGQERLDDVRPLCQVCHSTLHQLAAEGLSGLNPDQVFFKGRAAVYARTRPDLNAEQPKRLSEMTSAEAREYNKNRKQNWKKRDWRKERRLPRKAA
jgi:hypothetical protein